MTNVTPSSTKTDHASRLATYRATRSYRSRPTPMLLVEPDRPEAEVVLGGMPHVALHVAPEHYRLLRLVDRQPRQVDGDQLERAAVRRRTLAGIEAPAGLVEQLVDLGVPVVGGLGSARRDVGGMERRVEAEVAVARHRDPAQREQVVRRLLGAQRVQVGAPLHPLEVHLDAELGELREDGLGDLLVLQVASLGGPEGELERLARLAQYAVGPRRP